jgi:hypothetical protein
MMTSPIKEGNATLMTLPYRKSTRDDLNNYKNRSGIFNLTGFASGKEIKNLFAVSRHKRHDRNHPGAFDRQSQFPLMACAIACYSARHDFSTFGHKIIENGRIFIINLYIGIRAKAAEFLSVKKLLLGIPVWSFRVLCFHFLFPLL